MDETSKEIIEERRFDRMIDLAPLEHLLIGSSVSLKDDSIFNSDRLKKDQALARDAEFLLKPYGLTTNTSSLEEIAKKRSEKEKFTAWFPDFIATSDIKSNYEFDLLLSQPSESGLIPNEFVFLLKRPLEEDKEFVISENECKEVFDKVTLSNNKKYFFSIDKQAEKGIIVLKYLPLLENIKQ